MLRFATDVRPSWYLAHMAQQNTGTSWAGWSPVTSATNPKKRKQEQNGPLVTTVFHMRHACSLTFFFCTLGATGSQPWGTHTCSQCAATKLQFPKAGDPPAHQHDRNGAESRVTRRLQRPGEVVEADATSGLSDLPDEDALICASLDVYDHASWSAPAVHRSFTRNN